MAVGTDQEKRFYSRHEVARILGVNVRTVDRLIKLEKLRAYKLTEEKLSRVLIDKDDFEAFLKSRGEA